MLYALLVIFCIIGYFAVSYDEERAYRKDTDGKISISDWRKSNVKKYESNMSRYACFKRFKQ